MWKYFLYCTLFLSFPLTLQPLLYLINYFHKLNIGLLCSYVFLSTVYSSLAYGKVSLSGSEYKRVAGCCELSSELCGFHKMWRMSWLTMELLTSEEGHCSREVVGKADLSLCIIKQPAVQEWGVAPHILNLGNGWWLHGEGRVAPVIAMKVFGGVEV